MNVVRSSSYQCHYQENAIGRFFWDNHKHKVTVESKKLTISPSIIALLRHEDRNQTAITLQFTGPIAGLNSDSVSDPYNQGPYMDIISYSITPENAGAVCTFDSAGGTPIVTMTNTQQNSNSFLCGLNPSIRCQNTSNGHSIADIVHYSGASLLNFGYNSTTTQSRQSQEFEYREYLDFNKKRLVHSMTKCYYKETSFPYDTNQIWSLRRSDHAARLGFTIGIPLLGFMSWAVLPDITYTPPSSATTSISRDWSLDYDIPSTREPINFEWITEVRTIFASNDDDTPDAGCCHDQLNWIKTIHQIKQRISITVNDDHEIAIEMLDAEEKRVCLSGYEDKTRQVVLFTGNSSGESHLVERISEIQELFETRF